MDKIKILERDGWACQICYGPAPREFRGTAHPDAPEIDHVVPRSRGGTDDETNLRCSHRRCNQEKLSFLDEELRTAFGSSGEVLDAVIVIEATQRMRDGQANGGRRRIELHGNPGTSKGSIKGGYVGGPLGGRATNVTTNGRKGNGGRVGGRATNATTKGRKGNGGRVGSFIANHRRWHVRRDLINLNCKLCQSV